MNRLASAERDVLLALHLTRVKTWKNAAKKTGAADPERFGEKVRHKVKRVEAKEQRHDQQQPDGPTGLWVPRTTGSA